MVDILGVVIAILITTTVMYIASIIYVVKMLTRLEDKVRVLENPG